MPRIGTPEADHVHKVLTELQYLAGIVAVCYLQREYNRYGGGSVSNLVEYGAFVFGTFGLAHSIFYLCADAVDSRHARFWQRPSTSQDLLSASSSRLKLHYC